MLRTLTAICKCDWADPSKVVAIPAKQATDAFPDETTSRDEIVVREIFNCGGDNVYYRYGGDCDNVSNFHAYIVPGQMLEVSTLQRVSVFSVNGSSVSLTCIRRNELVPSQGFIKQNQL